MISKRFIRIKGDAALFAFGNQATLTTGLQLLGQISLICKCTKSRRERSLSAFGPVNFSTFYAAKPQHVAIAVACCGEMGDTGEWHRHCFRVEEWGRDGRWAHAEFAVAVQFITSSWLIATLSNETNAARILDAVRAGLADHLVGQRPGCVKPRPKKHALPTIPRAQPCAE